MKEEIMTLIREIYALSKNNSNPQKLLLLWQKLYLYEKDDPNVIFGRDVFLVKYHYQRNEFWRLYDNAKSYPIYKDGQTILLELDPLPKLDDRDFASEKEKLEYHLKQAIRYAMRTLDLRGGMAISTQSLYHYCEFCAKMAADYLQNEDYTVRVISLQDCFCPNVGHIVCLVDFHGRYYIVDPTYRQFFLASSCMEEARFHVDEPFIAPGYFIDTQEKREILSSLLSCGYFECTKDVLKAYGDSFDLAQQSLECGPKLLLTPPKKSANDYLQAISCATGLYY